MIVPWISIHVNGLENHFQIRLAITSIWKVQFQQFIHFSVAYKELFHMICSTQKKFLGHFFVIVPWISIHVNGLENHFQIRPAITSIWKIQFQQFIHFFCSLQRALSHDMLNSKNFSRPFFVIVPWISIHVNGLENHFQIRPAITSIWKIQFKQFIHFFCSLQRALSHDMLNSKNFSRPFFVIVPWISIHVNGLENHFQIRPAITSIWKVQFQQFIHFSVAYKELFHMICSTQKKFLGHFFVIVPWISIHVNGLENHFQIRPAITSIWKIQFQQFIHFFCSLQRALSHDMLNSKKISRPFFCDCTVD